MADKQVIVGDVDVSRCDFLAKEDDYCSYSGEYRAYKGQCGCSDDEMCKDHPNCFYKKALKQLQRKEQKCEKLKQILTEIKPILELYANSKVGEEQLDGTYKIIVKESKVLGDTYITFDPRPAKQALQKINEVME